MNHNFSRVSDNFVVEARPVTRFPYCPTNCSKAQHVHRSTIGELEIQPILVLIHISRGVISTQTCANNPPHYFGCRTLKKEVINCFWARAEMACGITIPSPLNHVILGEDSSLLKKPTENLILYGIFAFHMCLKWYPSSSVVSLSYTDFEVKPFACHFHIILSCSFSKG